MPEWIIKLTRDWIFNKSTTALAEQIRQSDPASVIALKALQGGATFMDFVKAYVKATTNTEDDKVVDMLMVMPFKDVLTILFGSLAAISIPDGDDDPTNDITIGEALSRVVEKTVAEEPAKEADGDHQ